MQKHTHTHTRKCTRTCTQTHKNVQLQKKHTQKSPDDCLSAEKITVPQKSLSNSCSSVAFSLSGSGASLGIDCQAYCLHHLSVVSQGENTSTLGETRALRFPFNLTEIEAELKITAPPLYTPSLPFPPHRSLFFVCFIYLFIHLYFFLPYLFIHSESLIFWECVSAWLGAWKHFAGRCVCCV